MQFYWDGNCRELKKEISEKDISENSWLPHCLFRAFMDWVLIVQRQKFLLSVHLEQQLESSVGEEWSRKPDTGSGGVDFATVSILLTFMLVREVKNL